MTSNCIYHSTKIIPYVYLCIHKITGEFYIGYRKANKIPSSQDLPKYKTSSNIINPNFNEYNWIIVAEFFNSIDAYNFEQFLIYENWNNPLLLNKSCFYNKHPLMNTSHSQESKKKIGDSNRGKVRSEETKLKLRNAKLGKTSKRKAVKLDFEKIKNAIINEYKTINLVELEFNTTRYVIHKRALLEEFDLSPFIDRNYLLSLKRPKSSN